MRMLAAQLNYTVGDFRGNTKKILDALDTAREKKVDLVLFSELAVCGYPPEDLLLQEGFFEEIERSLLSVVEASKGLFVVVGTVRKNPSAKGKPFFNSAAVMEDGCLLGYQDKRLLPTYDVFDEARYFEPGVENHLWNWKGKKIAVTICEDIWAHSGLVFYQEDPIRSLAAQKPDLLLNLSASPYQLQKPSLRIRVCAKAAKTLQCPVLLCCQVGGNDRLVFDGYSIFVDADGSPIALGKGFEEDWKIVDLDQKAEPFAAMPDTVEEMHSALVLGLRDYFHKSGFQKACLGLSGGIDSSVVACLAVEALGAQNVLGLAMPSRFSSSSGLIDASLLAHNLQIAYKEISVDGIFGNYLSLLAPHFQGMPQDVTEENLQARIRGMILMAFSNKMGYILLSTGNKSEIALGYCTLYGDACGGLSVISDVTKTQVYELARYINRDRELVPHSSLTKPPSAELRPDQKDSDSLPEYSVIDKVLQLYVEEGMSSERICREGGIAPAVVEDIIARIHRAEYKRRQMPPGIRVSKKAFHVGRMFPIVQKWK